MGTTCGLRACIAWRLQFTVYHPLLVLYLNGAFMCEAALRGQQHSIKAATFTKLIVASS